MLAATEASEWVAYEVKWGNWPQVQVRNAASSVTILPTQCISILLNIAVMKIKCVDILQEDLMQMLRKLSSKKS